MSIFPKRIAQGDIVIIHLGIMCHEKRFEHPISVNTYILSPSGCKYKLFDKVFLTHPLGEDNNENWQNYNSFVRYRIPPIVVFSSMMSGKNSQQRIIDTLHTHKHMIHYYTSYETFDFQPGRYEVFSEAYSDGVRLPTKTREDDFFYVDYLSLQSVKTDSDNRIFFKIKNHSKEKCPFIYIRRLKLSDNVTSKHILLLGEEEREFYYDHTQEEVIISYAEGRQHIDITKECFCQKRVYRNPKLFSMKKKNDNNIYILSSEDDNTAFILNDFQSQSIWEKTEKGGLREMICNIDKETYQKMLEYSIIIEL